ncbi:MAG: sensor histidine kinase, partial [Myxococcota bacterium]
EEVLGRRSTEFLTPESQVLARGVLAAFFREGRCKDVPYQLVRRDGTLIDVRLSATAERDAEGRVTRSLAVMIDVTDQLRAERELAEYRAHLEELVEARTAELAAANRELEAFSFSVSHDLRAPLRAIQGFSQVLEASHGDALDPAGRDLLRRIRTAAVRQGQLIDDLLRLARTGRGEMRRETVDVAAVARSIGAELAAAYPHRKVELVVEDVPPARADAELVRILLENVLANAWKFTASREVAHVRVFAERGPEGVVYRVQDDGAGFDMARAGRLFAPFERLHSQAEFAGTGLGLAIVARIAARHGGRAWAEGAVGKGATVSFTLG